MPNPSLEYPLAFIDFEASSLEHDSYPIEVGVAIVHGRGGRAQSWSTLIRPTSSWRARGHWSNASQRVHGIGRDELESGMPTGEVMTKLNALVAPAGRVWCDGGIYDAHWLERLSAAAGIAPKFELIDLTWLETKDARAYGQVMSTLRCSAAPHRAGPDALRLLHAFASVISDHSAAS